MNGKPYELRLGKESAGDAQDDEHGGGARRCAKGELARHRRAGFKLHPKLLRFIIMLFQNPDINKNGAQLIFTSQDVSIMKNDVFRRDEIWFAARDEDEASTLLVAVRHPRAQWPL